MPNFASILKSEVIRLARKEVRRELDVYRKTAAQYRSDISELKQQVAVLIKQVARMNGNPSAQKGKSDGNRAPESVRFNAKGFTSHRKRLGLSAAEAGVLIGVSTPTIYGWEGGTKPRKSQLAAIAAFRMIGKREAKARLAELAEASE